MNQQKDKTNRTKIGFYENYYDQSGRLLYVSKEQKPKPEITRLINDEPVDYGLILKQDLQKRHLSLNKDKDREVSNKLNYHQVSHKGGDLKDRKADWQKVIRDDRQQNHYWYVKNHKKTLHHRGRLFTGLFLIWFLIGAIGFMSIVTGKLWEMSIKEWIKETLWNNENVTYYLLRSLGYTFIGVFGLFSLYLSVHRFQFTDSFKNINDYSQAHRNKSRLILVSLITLFLMALADWLTYLYYETYATEEWVMYLWITSFSTLAGIFVISTFIIMLIQFFYRKKFKDLDFSEFQSKNPKQKKI